MSTAKRAHKTRAEFPTFPTDLSLSVMVSSRCNCFLSRFSDPAACLLLFFFTRNWWLEKVGILPNPLFTPRMFSSSPNIKSTFLPSPNRPQTQSTWQKCAFYETRNFSTSTYRRWIFCLKISFLVFHANGQADEHRREWLVNERTRFCDTFANNNFEQKTKRKSFS